MNTPVVSRQRREFLTLAAGVAAGACWPTAALHAASKRSAFGGVEVGAISYSFRELPASAEQILDYLVKLGLDSVELMGDAAEEFAGAPKAPPFPRMDGAAGPPDMNSEVVRNFMAARQKMDSERAVWRQSVGMAPYRKLRKLYSDAGVRIDILKLGEASWSDANIDYAYGVAKVLGARGISFELDDKAALRLGAFATKHRLYNGMHNHGQFGDASFSADPMLGYSKYNMLNFDIGHYVGSTGKSPVEFLRKYHTRVTHLHLKDRKSPTNGGANMAWGSGDTPIADVLRLIKQERYPISAMIELEYPVPAASSVMAEMAKCVDYCRQALV